MPVRAAAVLSLAAAAAALDCTRLGVKVEKVIAGKLQGPRTSGRASRVATTSSAYHEETAKGQIVAE